MLQQPIPLHGLPIELIRSITNFLTPQDIASFCLTSRYIMHAVGIKHVCLFILGSDKKHEYRKNLDILERAFPSHWHCAWCEQFHQHARDAGPRRIEKEQKRECVESNGYLCDVKGNYYLCFHHVRQAVHRAIWNEEVGIGLEEMRFEREETFQLGKSMASMKVCIDPRIASGRMILKSSCTFQLDRREATKWNRLKKIMSLMPQIVAGCHQHSSDKWHACLKHMVEYTLKANHIYSTERCSHCPTDFLVHSTPTSTSDPMQVPLAITTWRDLGDGRNPFDTAWRRHCAFKGTKKGARTYRSKIERGGIRDLYENGDPKPPPPVSKEWTYTPIASFFEYPITNTQWSSEIHRLRIARVRAMCDPSTRSHQLMVVENNKHIKARGPLFSPPYNLTWDEFVDLGGMRGQDGIPLIEAERKEMISEHGLWGGLMTDLNNIDLRRERWKVNDDVQSSS